jgi:hypothetical protein
VKQTARLLELPSGWVEQGLWAAPGERLADGTDM